jgi:hypothetical protein
VLPPSLLLILLMLMLMLLLLPSHGLVSASFILFLSAAFARAAARFVHITKAGAAEASAQRSRSTSSSTSEDAQARTHKQARNGSESNQRIEPADRHDSAFPASPSLPVRWDWARPRCSAPPSLTLQSHGLLLAKRTTPAEAATFRPPTVSLTSLETKNAG